MSSVAAGATRDGREFGNDEFTVQSFGIAVPLPVTGILPGSALAGLMGIAWVQPP